MRLQLRPYQQECLQRAIKHNTIVSLDTGLGKTLIAARLIEHYLHKHPDKKVAFLVPTRPLVEQQSRYCMEHCCVFGSQPMIQRLVGQDQAGWQLSDWENCVRQSHILIGTPAVFQQAFLTGKFLEISRFSLLVFDECHNATG
jgi:ERCC4-related helicase